MPAKKRHLVDGYPGIYFLENRRPHGNENEKIYYIRYRLNGRQIEEKVGGHYRNRMTAAKASRIRSLRIEGRELPNRERRKKAIAEIEARKNRPTLQKIWQRYSELKAANRALRTDRSRYERHIRSSLGDKDAREISTQDVDSLRLELEQNGKAPQTVKHVLMLVKRLLNFAWRVGLLENMPISIEMPRVDNSVTENLNPAQIRKLLEVLADEKNQARASIVRLALFTGMRKTAILRLKWEDLDFEHGFIHLARENAKKARSETIPMNSHARRELLALPRGKSQYVFPGRDPQKPLANISGLLRRVAAKAGLPEGFRPMHGLRHVFASWLASSGKVSMYELQKLLTHSSPKMTQRYAHLHDNALRRAANVADSLFSKIKIHQDRPIAKMEIEENRD